MDTLTNRHTYSSAEVCALADITYRQLDYWCRIGAIVPSAHTGTGSGNRRRFTAQDVLVLAVLALVGAHLRISMLDDLGAVLRGWDAATWDDTTLLVAPSGVWLADQDGAPPVATAINLAAIRELVAKRAAELDT